MPDFFCTMETNAVLDASTMNKFISSLSKSLQALCHGCMDFDNGIEMIGYININIDSENKVDCVLNEKVKRSSKTNSMTFISNSFLARKEKAKVTREASCSPIPELENRSFSSRKCHDFNSKNGSGGGRKRHWKEHSDTTSQRQFEDFPSYSEALQHQSDLNIQHPIKQEVEEGDQSILSANLSSEVKHEHSDLQTEDTCQNERDSDLMCSGNTSSDHPSASFSLEYEHDQSSAELTSVKQAVIETTTPSTSEQSEGVENFKHCAEVDDHCGEEYSRNTADCSEDMNYMEEGETSTVPDEFEVIEIGDDDEVQGLFAQPGPQNILGRHEVGSCQSSLVWNSNNSRHPTTYFSDTWRERRKEASRIYRSNMSHEKRERERWLARIRQRRRRARLRQQASRSQVMEAQYNLNFRPSIKGSTQKLENLPMLSKHETDRWK